jgi:hypothetical protein
VVATATAFKLPQVERGVGVAERRLEVFVDAVGIHGRDLIRKRLNNSK